MVVVIDRFEGEYAVCEMDNKEMVNIERSKVPSEAKEGDVLGSTTINIYSHALLSTDQAASDSMQILIDRTRSKVEANQSPKASG